MVNVIIRRELRAEVRSDGNKVVPGFSFMDCDPVSASGFAQPITWKGRAISDVALKEMRIVFRITDADLFSFDFSRKTDQ